MGPGSLFPAEPCLGPLLNVFGYAYDRIVRILPIRDKVGQEDHRLARAGAGRKVVVPHETGRCENMVIPRSVKCAAPDDLGIILPHLLDALGPLKDTARSLALVLPSQCLQGPLMVFPRTRLRGIVGDQGTDRNANQRRQTEFPHHIDEGREDHATSLGDTAAALCSGGRPICQRHRSDVRRTTLPALVV